MTINPNAEYQFISFLLFIISFIVSILFYFVDNNIIITCIVFVCLIFVSFRFYITFCKTIVIDESGVSISLLFYKRAYYWSDLKTKKVVDLSENYGYKDTATRGVEFSPFRTTRHSLLKSASYSFFFHPLDFVFIYFHPESTFKYTTNYSMPYVVDEEDFLKKMNDYSIELEEYDSKRSR